jgi:hypothetical protein
VPAGLVGHEGDSLALLGLGDDRGGHAVVQRLVHRSVDLFEVVAVDNDGVPAECLDAALVRLHVPLELGGTALAQPVDVDDGGDVVELLEACPGEALPDGALGALAVADNRPHVVRGAQRTLGGHGHAYGDGKALSERSGGDVDPRDDRGGMALKPAAELAVGEQLFVVDGARGAEQGVDEGRSVALGEDQVVAGGVVRVIEAVTQVTCQQDRHEVGRGK